MSELDKTRILLMVANPPGTQALQLPQELRKITQSLERAALRERFEVRTLPAARWEDVRRAMLEFRPHIVHFSGHGQGVGGLVFEDESGRPRPISTAGLANFFRNYAGRVQCVLLNACYSKVQARTIAQSVDHVIGMDQAIADRSAVAFATGFYDALGAGETIPRAFEEGRSAIDTEAPSGVGAPILRTSQRLQSRYCRWASLDVYVSFAVPPDSEAGEARLSWVDDLAGSLRNTLRKELNSDQCAIGLDFGAREDSPVTDDAVDRLSKTALFLIVLTPGYADSERCLAELQCFLDAGGDARRVFIAAQWDLPPPQPLQGGLAGPRILSFWGSNAAGETIILGTPGLGPKQQFAYLQRVNDLARYMAPVLASLRDGPAGAAGGGRATANLPGTLAATLPAFTPASGIDPTEPPHAGPGDRRGVYLADVPDDLIEPREDLRRFLDQQGYRVLPAQAHYFPGDSEQLHSAIDADLNACVLFLQVLGATVAHRPEGFVTPSIQLRRARAVGLPVLQWRSPDLVLDRVANPEQRDLLAAPEVVASPLEPFKQQILRKLPPPRPPPAAADAGVDAGGHHADGRLIFINASRDDRDLARRLSALIERRRGLVYAMPLDHGAPEQIRGDLEGNLRDADAILLLYGQSPTAWVREQLRRAFKVTGCRPKLPFFALCEVPPPAPIDMQIPDWIRTYDLDPAGLESFLARVVAAMDGAEAMPRTGGGAAP